MEGLWQMETEKGVARGLNVPGLEARMCPAAAENHESL